MMTIQSVIDRLQKTMTPARSLDASIGELTGWIKKVEMKIHPVTKKAVRRVSWIDPQQRIGREPPRFTFEIAAAVELTKKIAPEHAGAISWDGPIYFAQIEGAPKVAGLTPPIAICIAALKRLQDETGRK